MKFMNEKELSKFFWLQKEIKDLEERIATLDSGLSAIKYNSLSVSGSKKVESIQEKIVELKESWMEKRISALEEYIKMEKFILSVQDDEIRLILRYRFMDLMKWEEIGNKLGYDRTSVAKKIRNFLKTSNFPTIPIKK